MTATVRNAICLHSRATDLEFLNPVHNRMAKLLEERFSLFQFADQCSSAEAKLALRRKQGAFVIIFAHGGSNYVRGGEYVHRITREIMESPKFLTFEDLHLFAQRTVFCLSCDSNGLAAASLEAGATAFVGFDAIPFNRYDTNGNPIGNHAFQKHAQRLIAGGVEAMLERFVSGHSSLDEAVDFLQLWIDNQAIRFARRFRAVAERREIAALLLKVKDGVRYHGPCGIRFVS